MALVSRDANRPPRRWGGCALVLLASASSCSEPPQPPAPVAVAQLQTVDAGAHQHAPSLESIAHRAAYSVSEAGVAQIQPALPFELQLVPLPAATAADTATIVVTPIKTSAESAPAGPPPGVLLAPQSLESLSELPEVLADSAVVDGTPAAATAASKPPIDDGGDATSANQPAAPAIAQLQAAVEPTAPIELPPVTEEVDGGLLSKLPRNLETLLSEHAPPADPVDNRDQLAEAEALLADAGPTATGSPTGAIVSERARAKIRRGYALAQRGAHFAARAEFIEVLSMIAQAKDQKRGAARRTVALANGLRALEEAADFTPRGAEFDDHVNMTVIVSAHRTPVAKSLESAGLMPQQMADLYFRYAQVQLASAVAGEPSGSMALHALGKLYSQLGKAEADSHPQADRRAFALQQAALLARTDNHLAAHELGVLLAESGHYGEAEYMLAQVAIREPHAVVFRNLARVERRLGHEQLANNHDRHAKFLAAQDAEATSGVVIVSPETLAHTGDATGPAAPARVASGPPVPQPRGGMPPAGVSAPYPHGSGQVYMR